MSDNKNKYIIESTNFDNIIDQCDSIEIPVFQRDYAQGRASAKEILEGFLNDIFNHLNEDKLLKLSFIYGEKRLVDNNKYCYIPYDGQQRLTLLYLLSLYFAARSEEWGYIAKLSKFIYRTRDNATEFCHYLTSFDKEKEDEQNNIFKRIDFDSKTGFKQQVSLDVDFIDSWIYDPTVYSMLEVLDKIHNKIQNEHTYNQKEDIKTISKQYLDSLKEGKVFFDWCTIQASDDIYIKMNGRGKPLTAFDNFKNTLFAELNTLRRMDEEKGVTERVSFLKNFEEKMEGSWTSLFWKERNSFCQDDNIKHNIAPVMMNFLFYIFELRNTTERKGFYFDSKKSFCVINEKNVISFLSIFSEKCKEKEITLDDYVWLCKVMDIISSRIDEDERLKDLLIALYPDRKNDFMDFRTTIELAIYLEYLVNVSSFDEEGNYIESRLDNCDEWIELSSRVMNTVSKYEGRYDALIRDRHIFYGLKQFFISEVFNNDELGSILKTAKIFNEDKLQQLKPFVDRSHAFSQLKEELFKKELIEKDETTWAARIKEAEQKLPFFNNQIYFTFEIAKDNAGNLDTDKFDNYIKAISKLTNKEGIKENYENKFTAILLAINDYRIQCEEGRANALSLCSNKASKYFNWRHLFDVISNEEEGLIETIRAALNIIIENDYNVNKAYKVVKSDLNVEKWREIIIKYPDVLDRANRFRIVYQDDYNDIDKWYLINSGATKQVRRYSLDQSVNIEMYGVCRDAGFKDDEIIIEGQCICLPDGIEITNELETSKYQLNGKKYKLKDYSSIVQELKNKRKEIER